MFAIQKGVGGISTLTAVRVKLNGNLQMTLTGVRVKNDSKDL